MVAAGEGLEGWGEVTPYGGLRARQRSVRERNAELIQSCRTETADGALLAPEDPDRTVATLTWRIAAVQRPAGEAVVTDGDAAVTLYHARSGRVRHILRCAGRRCRRA